MPLKAGDRAIDVKGHDLLTGEPWQLYKQAPHKMIVALSGLTWCQYCKLEAPVLQTASSRQWDPPFKIAILSSHDKDLSSLESLVRRYGLTYPVVRMEDEESVIRAYQTVGFPQLYVLEWSAKARGYVVAGAHTGGFWYDHHLEPFLNEFGIFRVDPDPSPKAPRLPPSRLWTPRFADEIAIRFASDAGGWILEPGGGRRPIPPWNPASVVGPAGNDVLRALDIVALSREIEDAASRRQIIGAAIEAVRSAAAKLDAAEIDASMDQPRGELPPTRPRPAAELPPKRRKR